MKNRFLRFTFVVFLAGLTSALMAFSVDGNENNPTNKKSMTSGEYFSKIKANQHTGTISIADVAYARESVQQMQQFKSQASNYQWTSMGPLNYGGPTKAIIIDNQDASGNTLYAGSTNGGVWTSTNYGATWSMVAIDEVLNVSSICQADNGTIYVATGVNLSPTSDVIAEGSTIGKGIYKSTNGTAFELMTGTAPSENNTDADWAFIQKIAVDASGTLFAATNTGLKYFTGSEWSYTSTADGEIMGHGSDVVAKNGSIIAAVDGNVYISSGNANAFVMKSGDEEGMLPLGPFGNIKFDISMTNADYMYASYVKMDGTLHNVYASVDKGNTWRVVYPGGSEIGDIFFGKGLRNNAIAVSLNDEKTVYLGAADVYKGYEAQPTGYFNWNQITNSLLLPSFENDLGKVYVHSGINYILFNPSKQGHAFVCSDGGMSITRNNFNSTEIMNRGYNTTEYYTINASKWGSVLAGAQYNGVHRIEDNGSKQAQEMLNGKANLGTNATGGFNHISFINPEFVVCSDAGGNFWRSEDEGVNQTPILGDVETGAEFISPFLMWETANDPYSIDTAEFYARTRAYDAGEEVYVVSNSYDFPFKTTLEERVELGQTALIRDIVSTKAFIAVEGAVYMTTGMLDYTAMPSWWNIGNIEGIPTCMAYSKDANYVWVGTLEGKLYRFSNIARAHTEEQADINQPGCIIATTEITLSTDQAVTSVSVDPKNDENIIITLGNYGNSDYVFASNTGMTDNPEFFSIQGNLPNMPVYASSFEVNADGLVFIGTENGMFTTSNFEAGSVQWNYEDAGFGNVPVFSIRQQNVNWATAKYPIGDNFIYYPGANNYGAMYVGTFGGGAYVSKDFVGFEEFDTPIAEAGKLELYPNPTSSYVNISFESSSNNSISVDVYDLSGKLVLNQHFNSQVGQTNIELELNNIENGSYLLRLQDGNKQYQSKLVISK